MHYFRLNPRKVVPANNRSPEVTVSRPLLCICLESMQAGDHYRISSKNSALLIILHPLLIENSL